MNVTIFLIFQVLAMYGSTRNVNYASKCTICLEELTDSSSIDLEKEEGKFFKNIFSCTIIYQKTSNKSGQFL